MDQQDLVDRVVSGCNLIEHLSGPKFIAPFLVAVRSLVQAHQQDVGEPCNRGDRNTRCDSTCLFHVVGCEMEQSRDLTGTPKVRSLLMVISVSLPVLGNTKSFYPYNWIDDRYPHRPIDLLGVVYRSTRTNWKQENRSSLGCSGKPLFPVEAFL